MPIQSNFLLKLVNGISNGHDTVSSAEARINGACIVKISDFNSHYSFADEAAASTGPPLSRREDAA